MLEFCFVCLSKPLRNAQVYESNSNNNKKRLLDLSNNFQVQITTLRKFITNLVSGNPGGTPNQTERTKRRPLAEPFQCRYLQLCGDPLLPSSLASSGRQRERDDVSASGLARVVKSFEFLVCTAMMCDVLAITVHLSKLFQVSW